MRARQQIVKFVANVEVESFDWGFQVTHRNLGLVATDKTEDGALEKMNKMISHQIETDLTKERRLSVAQVFEKKTGKKLAPAREKTNWRGDPIPARVYGLVAQLGERSIRTGEVRGSTPL